MFPQLDFAKLSKEDLKKAGKLLSFKAVAYRTERWAEGQLIETRFKGKSTSFMEVLETIFPCSTEAKN